MNTKADKPKGIRSLATTLAIAFFALSVVILLVNGSLAVFTNYVAYQETIAIRQQLIAQNASKTVASSIEDKFTRLETAIEYANPVLVDSVTRKNILDSLLGLDPAFRQFALLDKQGRQLGQASRVSQALLPEFVLQFNGELLTKTQDGHRYFSPVYIDTATNEPLIAIAIPVTNILGDYQGSLTAEVSLKFMWDLVDQLKIGETGYVYVVDNKGNLIASEDRTRVLANENVKQIFEVQEFIMNPGESSDITPEAGSYIGLLGNTVVGSYVPLGTPDWAVVTELPTTEAYRPIIQSMLASAATLLVFAIFAGLAGIFVARRLSAPLIELSKIATEVSSGNLGLQAKVSGPAEIAQVSSTFNLMISRLRELIGALEQRVAERTKALSSVAEVSTAVSTILKTDTLLQEVVDLSKERFDFYHAHIYLINEAGNVLVLASGAGEVGRQMVAEGRSIPLDREQSLVARAAREKKGVTVNDVTRAPDFLPNPLLPDTRSELAVPMIVGEQVIGVFDVQSDIVGRFTEADIAVQTTLASQVASAVQNARLYTEAETTRQKAIKTAAQLSEALRIAKLANWEFDVPRDRFIFNDEFYAIFHTTAEREGGYELSSAQYAERLVYPDDLPMVGTEIGKALASTDKHYSARLEHRIVYADGGFGYISVEVHIERDDQGNILRYYGANQDITERKLLQIALERRAKQQEAINLITQQIQSADTVETALQVAARELGRAMGHKSTVVTLEPAVSVGEQKNAVTE